jgi:hypothetical protein
MEGLSQGKILVNGHRVNASNHAWPVERWKRDTILIILTRIISWKISL